MKNIVFTCLLGGMLFAASCSFDENENSNTVDSTEKTIRTYQTDMYPDCWTTESSLQKAVVHTPPFASRVDTAFPFSYGFISYFRDISDVRPQRVSVNFWTLFPKTGANANLVVTIDSVTKTIFWQSLPLMDSVKKASEWKNINCRVALPGNVGPDDKIRIYVWCPDKQEIFVDDLTVKFIY
jgi:hypothetical protein